MNEEPVVGEGKRGRGVGEGGEEGGGEEAPNGWKSNNNGWLFTLKPVSSLRSA